LKKDIFGRTDLIETTSGSSVRRDAGCAAFTVRLIARHLLSREARALAIAGDLPGIPELIALSDSTLDREYIAGVPMQVGKPEADEYFRAAARLIRQLHRRGIAHNDLAKEPNFLVRDGGLPALIDFQLAWFSPTRSRLFRILAREDIRHLLKHKRTYCPDMLTKREQAILDKPALLSRLWMRTIKPVYLFVTRQLLGWRDREGAGDRF
jgi:RIO-like serine/threonine protein kinase